jgi:hypothetical protein
MVLSGVWAPRGAAGNRTQNRHSITVNFFIASINYNISQKSKNENGDSLFTAVLAGGMVPAENAQGIVAEIPEAPEGLRNWSGKPGQTRRV